MKLLLPVIILMFLSASKYSSLTKFHQEDDKNVFLDSVRNEVHLTMYDLAESVFLTVSNENIYRKMDLKNDLHLEWVNELDFIPFHYISDNYVSISRLWFSVLV